MTKPSAKPSTATDRYGDKLAGHMKPDAAPESQPKPGAGRLKRCGGSMNDAFNAKLCNSTLQTMWSPDGSPDDAFNFAGIALAGIAPQDELEGMLAAQMVAAHAASMECFRRAMIGEQTVEAREMNLRMANKASRTYAMLLETLDKRRGKGGQQKVTVEHVHRHIHVHEGAQPVAGHIRGAGGEDENSRQSHAQRQQPAALTHAPQPALRSEDQERQPVPLARHGER